MVVEGGAELEVGWLPPLIEGARNPKLATGDVEVQASEIRVLNDARTLPFQLDATETALAAEDLLDMALRGDGYESVAVFGCPGCEDRVIQGDNAATAIRLTLNSA